MVDSPEHVKKLTPEQLISLAADIRGELITKLAKAGGHLGPNLGVVELTIALHKVFSSPKDKFVWDVSHQIYVHKLLTAAAKIFPRSAKPGGPMGFALGKKARTIASARGMPPPRCPPRSAWRPPATTAHRRTGCRRDR